jgi:hypothetical protein
LATPYAERRWVEQCGYTWGEFVEWVLRLTPAHCRGVCKSTSPYFPEDLVDTYQIDSGTEKNGRRREIWIELVLCDDYVRVVSAHRTTMKRGQ